MTSRAHLIFPEPNLKFPRGRRKEDAARLLGSSFASPLHLHLTPSNAVAPRPALLGRISAAKQLTGRVVTTKADKTVGVEVVRLAPHPKYHRRERINKKYQAHDPENRFRVGDVVELLRSRPISKTKHFLAVPVPPRDTRRKAQLLPPLQSDVDGEVEEAAAVAQ
jgi:small subunit ribosomal protein S17